MSYLYRQEIFKLLKRRSTWIGLALLIIENCAVAVVLNIHRNSGFENLFFTNDFNSIPFIYFMMIAASSTIIATEFEYNTIKNIVSRQFSRKMVLTSKWLAILTYSLVVFLIMMLVTLINKFILLGDLSLTTTYSKLDQTALWLVWLRTNATNFVTLWLLLSVVLWIATMMKKGVTAVVTGIVGYLAISIIDTFVTALISKWEFVKWLPFNFLNYANQVASVGIISELTHLSNNELLVGSLTYTTIFLMLGLYFFSRKEI